MAKFYSTLITGTSTNRFTSSKFDVSILYSLVANHKIKEIMVKFV